MQRWPFTIALLAFAAHGARGQQVGPGIYDDRILGGDVPGPALPNAKVRILAEFPRIEIGETLPTSDPNRIYYATDKAVFLFDVPSKHSTLVAPGEMWNIDVSRRRDRLVSVRESEDKKVSYVWVLRLDARTGLATGPAHGLGLAPGDEPQISPEGKWVAYAAYDSASYSSPQHLAVIPLDGGPERVLARHSRGIGRIQWSPDGRSVYFTALFPRTIKLCRVAFTGGVVDTVSDTLNRPHLPGLSPDGRLLIEDRRGDQAGTYVLADTKGSEKKPFTVIAPYGVGSWGQITWNSDHSLLASGVRLAPSIRIVPVHGDTGRVLLESAVQPELPFWSPDGRSVATFARPKGQRVLMVVNVTTGQTREFAAGVQQVCCIGDGRQNLQWSPDGKFIAFHGKGTYAPLVAIELVTGAIRRVGDPGVNARGNYLWRSDSRALFYTGRHDTTRAIHEATLDGHDRIIIDRLPAAAGSVGMISDSTFLSQSESGVFLASAKTNIWTRLTPYRSVDVAWSADQTWFAVRPAGVPHSRQTVEIVDRAGTRQALVSLPVNAWSIKFLRDPHGLVFAGVADGEAIYTVDIRGGEPNKVIDLPRSGWAPATYLTLSPDRTQILYPAFGPPSSLLAEVDLSPILRSRPAARH